MFGKACQMSKPSTHFLVFRVTLVIKIIEKSFIVVFLIDYNLQKNGVLKVFLSLFHKHDVFQQDSLMLYTTARTIGIEKRIVQLFRK